MSISPSESWLLLTAEGGLDEAKQRASDTGGGMPSEGTAARCYGRGRAAEPRLATGCWGTVARVPRKERRLK